MAGRDEGRAAFVVAVLLADVALELVDALTFAALAATATPAPTPRQLGVVAILIAPRLVFVGLGAAVLRGHLRDRTWARPAAVGFLTLVSVQAAAGLFLLWGAGRGAAGRGLLTVANVGALVALSVEVGARVRPAIRGVRARR